MNILLLNHQHQRSHIVTASARDTFLYHRFILSVLCYSSFFHWYDGPIYIYMLRPLTLLANNHLTSLNDVASILLFHNQQPCSGIINILTCLLSYLSKIVYFQNYQPFSLSLKGREFTVMTLLFWGFQHLSDIYHAPAPYIANTIRFANTQIFSQF